MKKRMSLVEWIEEKGGNIVVAKLLKVTPSNVRQWRRGVCLPRAEVILKITKLSGEQVTWLEITEYFFEKKLSARV